MRISDIVANYILDMMDDDSGSVELKRNELALRIGCVPSQINYVITSRFTPEQGFIVESRRGGGGYIKITRVKLDKSSMLVHIINSIGNTINYNTATIIIDNLLTQKIIDKNTARLITVAVSDQCCKNISLEFRDSLRASLLKNLLLTQI